MTESKFTVIPGLKRTWLMLLAGVIPVALAAALYLPFLSNPLVFDDLHIYRWPLSYYATTLLGFGLRLPAYFSIAFVQTVSGQVEVHRLVSLVLHTATGLILYAVMARLLRETRPHPLGRPGGHFDYRCQLPAAGAASLFLVHPAAVYAAGYLIQRSIVLATFFSLTALFFFLRGASQRRYADAITAAVMSSLAILSKEHAVLFPAVALTSLVVVRGAWPFLLRYGAVYAAVCLPAALMVILLSQQNILTPFEYQFDSFVQQVAAQPAPAHPWLESVATQAQLFFKYLATWVWPQTAAMSIDTRIGIEAGQGGDWRYLSGAGFVMVGILAALAIRLGGTTKLVGFGLLFVWIQFLVDMSTVRLQEPFVIYRSYLWAPGIAIMLAALLSRFPLKFQTAVLVAAGTLFFVQANDRLTTFSHPLLLWEDAAAKLPPRPVLGDARIFANLAREYMQVGRPEDAVATISRCTDRYPDYYHCVFARGAIHLFREDREEYDLAQQWLSRAVDIRPESALAHHHLGLTYEKRDQPALARSHYREAARLGFVGGDYRLELMDSTTGAVTIYSRDRLKGRK